MVKIRPFNTAEYLDNPEVVAHYLADALESNDRAFILSALQDVMRASRMTEIARKTGRSRTSLYWREGASPEFATVLDVLNVLRVKLVPVAEPRSRKERAPKDVVIAGRKGDPTAHHVTGAIRSMKARKKK
jgi:probable addiction module antidote protein